MNCSQSSAKLGPLGRQAFVLSLILWGLQLSLSAQGPSWREHHVLIQPRSGLPQGELANLLQQHGGRSVRVLGPLNIHLVELPPAANETAVAAALARGPQVQFAELDRLLPLEETTPNDPHFDNGWHLPMIGAPEAWDVSLGEGITVAVLDTGVDPDHPDLAGQMAPGWNFYDDNPDFSDVYGHGTKVAGVVAAASNNALGVTSVAWNATILPIRVSKPDGRAFTSTIAQALSWAADQGARVANISYSVSGSSSVKSAADYMKSLGGLVVVSAGNTGSYQSYSPSPSLISVAATDSNDNRTSWSSYGEYVDLAAPGSGIWTTANGGGYSAPSGTSFSSPTTAAVIALVMSANPSLSPEEVEAIVTQTAQDRGSAGYDIYYGHGRVDAVAAVYAALGDEPAPDTQSPSVAIIEPTGGSVSDLVPVNVSASDNVGVTGVDFFVDGILHASDASAPYQFTWDSRERADGPAVLSAAAYDEAGNQGLSSTVTVEVDNVADAPDLTPPVVSIDSPQDGDQVSKTVQIAVSASDDRALSWVELHIDGQHQRSDAAGFNFSWNTRRESAGFHTLTAYAWDEAGNQSSFTITVEIASGGSKGGGKGKGKP